MSVYDARPYHAYCLSDAGQEDDDICMWPELPDTSDSEDSEVSYQHVINRIKAVGDTQAATRTADERREVVDIDIGTAQLPTEDSRDHEDQIKSALSTAYTNLTRMSQLVLKLEYRAGKVTKEGIRQTLDATVADKHVSPRDDDPTHLKEIEEIKCISQSVWKRLYLIDRHWSRQSRSAHDEGRNSSIQLRSEPGVKAMLKEEIRMNHLACEDTRYFTVADLANGRHFKDWVAYLKDLCQFQDHPTDEAKLVELAWLFLDRALRGPRPVASTKIEDFIMELEDKVTKGVFEEALRQPKKQQEDDEQAWKIIRKRLKLQD